LYLALRPVACCLTPRGTSPAGKTQTTSDGTNPVGVEAGISNRWLALYAGFTTVMADGLRLCGSVGDDHGLGDSRQAAKGRVESALVAGQGGPEGAPALRSG
jgi:hypothetical protein